MTTVTAATGIEPPLALVPRTLCIRGTGLLKPALQPRHCERSEAIQTVAAARLWMASLRSQ
jgi:hypothetical protein